MAPNRRKALALLSFTGLGGICSGSLAPLTAGSGVVEGGAKDGSHNNNRRHQDGQPPQQGSRRRRRPSTSTVKGGGFGEDEPVKGIFNSFSLAEHEPSCFFGTTDLAPRQGAHHHPHQEGPSDHRDGRNNGGVDPAGGGAAATASVYDPLYDSNNESYENESYEHDDEDQLQQQQQQQQQQQPCLYAENVGFDAGPGSHYYYPGRGRNAAQSLLSRTNNGDISRFYSSSSSSSKSGGVGSSSSAFRHGRPLSFFAGGRSPYSGGSGGAAGAVRRRRRRARGGSSAASALLPTVPPSVTAAAAAAAGVLVRITAAAGLALAVLAPLAAALSSHWGYFLAGGLCAAISHTAAVPLDVIKTRIQCAPPGEEYRGTWDALVRICRSEGGRVLFFGAGATLVGYALQGSLKFGFFEFLKPVFTGLFARGGAAAAGAAAPAPVIGILIAASVTAEIIGSSALTPLEAARIRMVADADYAPGLRSGIARMIAEEGVGSLARGLPAVLAKQVPYTVTKLVTFDYLVRSVASRFARGDGGGGVGGTGRVGSGVGVTVACAVIAGVLSSLASQPGDTLLSALNSEGRKKLKAAGGGSGDSQHVAFEEMSEANTDEDEDEGCSSGSDDYLSDGPCYPSTTSAPVAAAAAAVQEDVEPVTRAMARIVREIGVLGLFRGLGARMMHVTSIVTLQLLIYQSIKRMVGIES